MVERVDFKTSSMSEMISLLDETATKAPEKHIGFERPGMMTGVFGHEWLGWDRQHKEDFVCGLANLGFIEKAA